MRLSDNLLALLRNPEATDYALKDAIIDENHILETPMANIYVVFGTSGEYSDKREWGVAAFILESEAQEYKSVLNKWIEDNKVDYVDYEDRKEVFKSCPDKNAADNYVYSSISYDYYSIPLVINQ